MSTNVIRFMPRQPEILPIIEPQLPIIIEFKPNFINPNDKAIPIIYPDLPADVVKPQALTNGQIIALAIGCTAIATIAVIAAMVIMNNNMKKELIETREDIVISLREISIG